MGRSHLHNQPIWETSVATVAEAEDAVGALLNRLFRLPASTHFNALKLATVVSVFSRSRPPRCALKTLKSALCELRSDGVDTGPARIRVRKLVAEDWVESWKQHFQPMEIGKALLLKPSWSRRKPRRGQAVMVLDPGLSFGTGQHATTAFCLRELVARRQPGSRQSVLDVGTGSGILAIAAAKLGYGPVDAFDNDPDAVRVARVNASRNRVQRRLQVKCQNLARMSMHCSRAYDVVCANLLSTLLISERERLASRVKLGGALVLAGILHTEFGGVQAAFEEGGWRLIASRREREWHSGTFCRVTPL